MKRHQLEILAAMIAHPDKTIIHVSHPPKENTMTTTETRNPETYTHGLGEVVRAHRLYIGLSQRDMADRVGKDRRDYQRIENGRDACPPGLLTQLETLSDAFCHQVDLLIEEAERKGGLALSVTTDGSPGKEWDRLVAGRAAVEATEDAPITLTVVNKPT